MMPMGRAALVGAVWLLISSVLPAPAADAPPARLRVSGDHRHLAYADGRPFFYLGDTAWQLFHRLSREEADRYLRNRAAKGFTVIQAVALAELDGLRTPNAYGHRPLEGDDPTRPAVREGPGNDYWDHVDWIVERAGELGLFVGMLPTWGDKWQRSKGGAGPVVFGPENARVYGRWIGSRYLDARVIWILGGDRNIESLQDRRTVEAMARGLRDAVGDRQLITYHPRGPGLSSDYFHEAEWLDFNMFQSSHGARDHDNGLYARRDRGLSPPKPTLDGEPRYETIPVGFYNSGVARHLLFDDHDVRQAAYWSLLAGACGHTYGNNSIWQMWQPGRRAVIDAQVPWFEALDHPGAFQMGHVRRLFESRPFALLEPDDTLVVDGPARGPAKIRAARARDGSFAFCYSSRGAPFSVLMPRIEAKAVQATWYDPRYGTAFRIHRSGREGIQTFTPPSAGRGCDWVLVLDDAERYPAPPGRVR